MIGISYFLLFLLWLTFVAWISFGKISRTLSRRLIANKYAALIINVALFVSLIPTPLVDEYIARPQFLKLCAKYAVTNELEGIKPNLTVTRGYSSSELASGTAIPISIQYTMMKNANDGSRVYEFGSVSAEGGWLNRFIGVAPDRPFLFDGRCQDYAEVAAINRKYNLKVSTHR